MGLAHTVVRGSIKKISLKYTRIHCSLLQSIVTSDSTMRSPTHVLATPLGPPARSGRCYLLAKQGQLSANQIVEDLGLAEQDEERQLAHGKGGDQLRAPVDVHGAKAGRAQLLDELLVRRRKLAAAATPLRAELDHDHAVACVARRSHVCQCRFQVSTSHHGHLAVECRQLARDDFRLARCSSGGVIVYGPVRGLALGRVLTRFVGRAMLLSAF